MNIGRPSRSAPARAAMRAFTFPAMLSASLTASIMSWSESSEREWD